MMKAHAFNLLLFLFFPISLLTAQTDTSKIFLNNVPAFNRYNVEYPNAFNAANFLNDSSLIWMRTRMQLSGMTLQDPMKNNFQNSILNPLRLQYSKLQSMKELKYILGAVQVGAVGYLAYQHLKKYGFLKRK